MRLTLRTMLAYLDDRLEPADAQEIGRKIEESEYAAELVHRIRDVMRRLRLGAPQLSGKGMGIDPNTVAEYLDNTLSADRVPDFEKVCLDSDVHLAEVASCHQILAIVLGEASEIEPSLRERCYKLREVATAETSATPEPVADAAATSAATAETATASTNGKSQVPDYLRDQPSGWLSWKLAVAVMLGFLLVGVVVMALNPGLLGMGGSQVAQNDDNTVVDDTNPGTNPADTNPANNAVTDTAGPRPVLEQPESVGTDNTANNTTDPEAGTNDAPPIPDEGTTANTGANTAANNATVDPPLPGEVKPPTDNKPANDATNPPVSNNVGGNPVANPPATGNTNNNTANNNTTNNNVPPVPDKPEDNKPATPAAVPSIGRFTSNTNIVLLRLDRETQQWNRLATQATLFPGDALISLPTFRSTIALSSGVTLQLLGDTIVELEAPDADGVPVVRLAYGQLVGMTIGDANAQVKLRVADRIARVTFGDAGSTMAVELKTERIPGTDPREQPPEVHVDLFAATGSITWDEGADGEKLELNAESRYRLGSDQPPVKEAMPSWIASEQLSPLEKSASDKVDEYLSAEYQTKVEQGLRELADYRRLEVQALSARCLASIGIYLPTINALEDDKQRAFWSNHIETLQDAIGRSPEAAIRVYELLVMKHGEEDGQKLFRMLWGYTRENLEAGEASNLVDYLDHEDLDFRVLASWNLREITGTGSILYRPEASAAQRKQYVQKWRQRLDSGQILPGVGQQ